MFKIDRPACECTRDRTIHPDILNQPIEQLDGLLSKYNSVEVVSFFADATESERKQFAYHAMAWFRVSYLAMRMKTRAWAFSERELANRPRLKNEVDEVRELQKQVPKQAFDERALEPARVAILSSCSLKDLKRWGEQGLPEPSNSWLVLENRKPKWAGSWLDFACEQRPILYWETARRAELSGLASLTRNSSYWRGMAMALAKEEASIIEDLKADSELLENHIWCLLEDSPTMLALSYPSESDFSQRVAAINNAVNVDEYLTLVAHRLELASNLWHQTLIDLVRSNLIDKERFMEVIISWITRVGADDGSRKAATAGRISRAEWFTSILDAFDFNKGEQLALVPKLIAMLAARDPKVLYWSLKRLYEYSHEALHLEDFVVNLKSLMRVKGKDHAILAIKFVEELCDSAPESAPLLANGLLAGLEHPSKDIQTRVIDFVKKRNLIVDKSVLTHLQISLDGLSVLVRNRVEKLLPDPSTTILTPADGDCSATSARSAPDFQSLATSIASLPTEVCEVSGLQDALDALKRSEDRQGIVPFAQALKLDFIKVPRLDPAKAVNPIKGIADLIYRLLHVFASSWKWEELELCLDAIMRFASCKPDDLQAQLSPLRKAAVDLLAPNGWERSTPFRSVSTTTNLAALIIAWTDRIVLEPQLFTETTYVGNVVKSPQRNLITRYEAPWGNWRADSGSLFRGTPTAFFCKRLIEIANRVSKMTTLPLLSAPTHEGGWIDPQTLVSRMIAWDSQGELPDNYNFIQALLRLAPDGRREALSEAKFLKGEQAAVIRFALGEESEISSPSKAAWWVAAARARDPLADFQQLASQFPELGPDSTISARYDTNIKEIQKPKVRNREFRLFEVTPKFCRREGINEFPTELFHRDRYLWDSNDQVEEGLWLQSRESYFAYTAAFQARNLGSKSSSLATTWDPIFDTDVPACGFGTWLIGIGLSSANPINSRWALDALIACIEDTRLDGSILGDTLASLLETGEITSARWEAAFKECARISALHLQVVRLALEHALPPKVMKESHRPNLKLLELLLDLSSLAGETISFDPMRKYLGELGTKGKTGKLATSLLELCDHSQQHRQSAALQVVNSRLRRAERYARVLNQSKIS